MVKYAPCSQSFGCLVENKDSNIVEGNYRTVIWQKSGIGLTAHPQVQFLKEGIGKPSTTVCFDGGEK